MARRVMKRTAAPKRAPKKAAPKAKPLKKVTKKPTLKAIKAKTTMTDVRVRKDPKVEKAKKSADYWRSFKGKGKGPQSDGGFARGAYKNEAIQKRKARERLKKAKKK